MTTCVISRVLYASDLIFRVSMAIILLALCIAQAQSRLSVFTKIVGTVLTILIIIRQVYGTSTVSSLLGGKHVRRESLVMLIAVCMLLTLWVENGIGVVFAYLSMGLLMMLIMSDAGALREPEAVMRILRTTPCTTSMQCASDLDCGRYFSDERDACAKEGSDLVCTPDGGCACTLPSKVHTIVPPTSH